MKSDNNVYHEALAVLRETSRTFDIPLRMLEPVVQELAVSAYLCMRALDEIEDHPYLPADKKTELLRTIAGILRAPFTKADLQRLLMPYATVLPEVTLRLADWLYLYPCTFSKRLWEVAADMADQMADWAKRGWQIESEKQLNHYTYSVAGMVGILLSDLWRWYDGTVTDYGEAVSYGRGLQAVNIILNRSEDLARGVNFYPQGWEIADMMLYARSHLALGKAYVDSLQPGSIRNFCSVPLALAYASIDTLAVGKPKLTRAGVLEIVQQMVPDLG